MRKAESVEDLDLRRSKRRTRRVDELDRVAVPAEALHRARALVRVERVARAAAVPPAREVATRRRDPAPRARERRSSVSACRGRRAMHSSRRKGGTRRGEGGTHEQPKTPPSVPVAPSVRAVRFSERSRAAAVKGTSTYRSGRRHLRARRCVSKERDVKETRKGREQTDPQRRTRRCSRLLSPYAPTARRSAARRSTRRLPLGKSTCAR